MSELQICIFDAFGATVCYDVRAVEGGNGVLLLMLIGLLMGVVGFVMFLCHFLDCMVVIYDPRGVECSKWTDGADQIMFDEYVDDLHCVIAVVGGWVDLFVSSGGVVNVFAFVACYFEDVRTFIVHELFVAVVLFDCEEVFVVIDGICVLYERDGFGLVMVKFIVIVLYKGLVFAGFVDQFGFDPVMFGLLAFDDGLCDDVLLG